MLLLLLLLSHFNHVWLCATPCTAAYQASPSMGFSRQEHWSGFAFPSPMHESEKWKWSRSVMSDSATPWTAAHQAPPFMGFSRQQYWSGLPVLSAYLRLLMFLPATLIPACASSNLAFCMMYSACKLKKRVTVYSLDVLLSHFWTNLLFHVQF